MLIVGNEPRIRAQAQSQYFVNLLEMAVSHLCLPRPFWVGRTSSVWGAGGIKVPFQLFIIPKTCPGIQARETKHVQSQRTFIFYAVSQVWTTISLGKNKTISDGGITIDFWFIKVHTSN